MSFLSVAKKRPRRDDKEAMKEGDQENDKARTVVKGTSPGFLDSL
jgi:hypothetical protein